ncbi:hypothetical protein [Kitasatospora indigofera]|uniref:hypothetical protein n=1 Tax=Kitasatospora indigofera TaxID=67307 RepID=UPI0032454B9F
MVLLSSCGASGGAGSADRLGTSAPSVAAVTPVTPSGGSGTDGIAPTDGPEGAIGRAALRTYQDWWAAQTDAFGRSDSDASQLQELSTGKALSEAVANLHQLHEAKLVMIGSPRNSPVVKAIDLKADPQTAVVEDCLDVADWHQADATTRATKDPQKRLTRYIATVSLRKSGARWLIVEFKREVDRTC